MTIWEILIGGPMAVILVITIIIAIIGFPLLIVGFPFLIKNFYKNYKNQAKISFKEILAKKPIFKFYFTSPPKFRTGKFLEGCRSGLTERFAKPWGSKKPRVGSNPTPSVFIIFR